MRDPQFSVEWRIGLLDTVHVHPHCYNQKEVATRVNDRCWHNTSMHLTHEICCVIDTWVEPGFVLWQGRWQFTKEEEFSCYSTTTKPITRI